MASEKAFVNVSSISILWNKVPGEILCCIYLVTGLFFGRILTTTSISVQIIGLITLFVDKIWESKIVYPLFKAPNVGMIFEKASRNSENM